VLCLVFVVLAAGGGFFYFQMLENERVELEAIRLEQERIARLEIARREQERLEQERLEQERMAARQVVVTMSEEGTLQAAIGPVTINVPLPEGFVDIANAMPPEAISEMRSMPAAFGSELLTAMIYAEDVHAMQHPSLENFAPPRMRMFIASTMPLAVYEGDAFQSLIEVFSQMSDAMGGTADTIDMFEDYQGNVGQRISELITSGNMPQGMGVAPFNLEPEHHTANTSFMYMYFEFLDERTEFGSTTSFVSILIDEYLISAMFMSHSIHDLNFAQDIIRNWVEAIHRVNI